jgi:hypothetical protein
VKAAANRQKADLLELHQFLHNCMRNDDRTLPAEWEGFCLYVSWSGEFDSAGQRAWSGRSPTSRVRLVTHTCGDVLRLRQSHSVLLLV